MSAYVDELQEYPEAAIAPALRRFGRRWAHLTADTLPELHYMANYIGLQDSSFQHMPYPHYNLVPSKRTQAIRAGALRRSSVQQTLECRDMPRSR